MPIFHQALVRAARLAGDVAVVNIGGVANVTLVKADGALIAFDTGPGNALIDDMVRERTGAAMDRDGALSLAGTVQTQTLAELHRRSMVRSSAAEIARPRRLLARAGRPPLGRPDAAATLAAFTAEAIARGIRLAGGADRIVVCGGGAHNPAILRALAAISGVPVTTADAHGWSVDFIEAQAFAYLAARRIAGLPISFPETTGCPAPMTGGVLSSP